MVDDAIACLPPSSIDFKSLVREVDGLGDVRENYGAVTTIEYARVIPTSPKDLKFSPELAVFKESYSVYLFGSFSFEANDRVTYNSFEYEIIQGWDRNQNGGYTKIIIARDKKVGYTDA